MLHQLNIFVRVLIDDEYAVLFCLILVTVVLEKLDVSRSHIEGYGLRAPLCRLKHVQKRRSFHFDPDWHVIGCIIFQHSKSTS